MEGVPGHILDAIRKAIDNKTTYTEYLKGEVSEELADLLKKQHLLIVRHPRQEGQYKIFVPVKFRTNRP